jgi:hypothetical protein
MAQDDRLCSARARYIRCTDLHKEGAPVPPERGRGYGRAACWVRRGLRPRRSPLGDQRDRGAGQRDDGGDQECGVHAAHERVVADLGDDAGDPRWRARGHRRQPHRDRALHPGELGGIQRGQVAAVQLAGSSSIPATVGNRGPRPAASGRPKNARRTRGNGWNQRHESLFTREFTLKCRYGTYSQTRRY